MFSLSIDYLIIHVFPIFDSFPLTSQPLMSLPVVRCTQAHRCPQAIDRSGNFEASWEDVEGTWLTAA